MDINIHTVYGLNKSAHSLEAYQQAYDLGSNANHSSENQFSDPNLIRAFINGYEQNIMVEMVECEVTP